MAFVDSRETRKLVRDKLNEYKRFHGLTYSGLETKLNEARESIGYPNIAGQKREKLLSEDTIERIDSEDEYLINLKNSKTCEKLYKFLVFVGMISDSSYQFFPRDLKFRSLCEFFGMDDNQIRACYEEKIVGVYNFYAWSEDRQTDPPIYVVVGAIKFDFNVETQTLHVEELQASQQREKQIRERWKGYFLKIKDHIIVIERYEDQARSPRERDGYIPKFYILTVRYYDTPDEGDSEDWHRYTSKMRGTMVKPASEGKGAFNTKVVLIPDQDAFSKCRIAEFDELEMEIKIDLLPHVGITLHKSMGGGMGSGSGVGTAAKPHR